MSIAVRWRLVSCAAAAVRVTELVGAGEGLSGIDMLRSGGQRHDCFLFQL
jgi:hypothetical protein